MAAPKAPHGKVFYLLIPTADPQQSADFYQEVFGWFIRESEQGFAFDDSVSQVHGRFTPHLHSAENPGAILYIMVRDASETEKRIVEYGGTVTDPANREEYDILGTFRDPSGNLFGFYEMKEEEEA